MAKSIFGNLFGGKNEEEPKIEVTPKVIENTPEEQPKEIDFSIPVPVYKAGDENNQFLETFNKMYDEGFKSLNRDGVDFFEFYDSVTTAGIDDPKSYEMTMKILRNVDKTFTKEFVVEDGKYYLESIHKKYEEFKGKGVAKRDELNIARDHEKEELYNEIGELERKFNELQTTLNAKKELYRTIKPRYESQLNEVDGKLKANDIARNLIIGRIRKVIMNIKQHVKES